MGKAIFYRQCLLKKGTLVTTSWIPEKFAVLGKVLKLKDDDGSWDNGWVVEAVYGRLEESKLPDSHREIRKLGTRTGGDSRKKRKKTND
jgi:hypothetical protein